MSVLPPTRTSLRSAICAISILVALSSCSDAADEPRGDPDVSAESETPKPSSQQAADSGARNRDAGSSSAQPVDPARPAKDAGSTNTSVVDSSAPPPADGGGSLGTDGAGTPTDAGASDAQSTMTFAISSPVAMDGMALPKKHRCARSGGENVSPPLTWSAGPAGTLSYALVMRDVTNTSVVLHWFIYDLPASSTGLPEQVATGYQPAQPAGAKQGPSYSRTLGYQGPCGGDNTYEFAIYALDVAQLPSLSESSSGAQITAQIELHELASDKLTVTSSPRD